MKLLEDVLSLIGMILLIGAIVLSLVAVWGKKNRFGLDSFDKTISTIALTTLILLTILVYIRTLT